MSRVASAKKGKSAPRTARRVIPLDDEPLTPADMRAIAQADEDYRRGKYYTLEEAKAYVARLRSRSSGKKPR